MTTMTTRKQILGLIGWLALCFAASGLGAVASIQASTFYAGLVQPDWAPPGWLFGPVWMVLYAMMGVAAWLVWREGGFASQQRALLLFLAQLAVNALWSWLFFAWHQGALAFADIALLWVLIVVTLFAFLRVRPLAGWLMVPYWLWVSFAAALNWTVWHLNPQILG